MKEMIRSPPIVYTIFDLVVLVLKKRRLPLSIHELNLVWRYILFCVFDVLRFFWVDVKTNSRRVYIKFWLLVSLENSADLATGSVLLKGTCQLVLSGNCSLRMLPSVRLSLWSPPIPTVLTTLKPNVRDSSYFFFLSLSPIEALLTSTPTLPPGTYWGAFPDAESSKRRKRPLFKNLPWHSSVLWTWASLLTTVNLRFLFQNMGQTNGFVKMK